MPIKYIKASLPHLNLLTKVLLVLLIMAMSAFGAFAIRMSKGPLNLEFAKARIEAALSNSDKGYSVKFNKLALTWPDMSDAVLLDLNGVQVVQKGVTALNIDHVSLGLSGLHLLKGDILPSIIIIDEPTFQLVQEDGAFNFFWQKKNKQEGDVRTENKLEKPSQKIRASIQQFLSQITDPKNSDIDALSALKRFELKRAVVKGDGFKKEGEEEANDYLALVDFSLRKNNLGLEGKLNISLASEEGRNAELKSDILYRRQEKDITFTADVKDINPARFASFFRDYPLLAQQDLFLNGAVKAAFDQGLELQLATLNLNIPEGKLIIPENYDAPIPLENVKFEAQLNRPKGTLNISTFNATIGGVELSTTAQGSFHEGDISGPIEINIPNLHLDKIPLIFPKSHLESNAGEWLTQKLSKGRLHDIVLNTDFSVTHDMDTKKGDAKMTNTKLSFKAEGVSVKYSDTLMPVTDVVGAGSYEGDTLTISAKTGRIGDIVGKNLKLIMTDLSVAGGGLADINLDASGPLRTALEYVSDEPIAVGDQLGFDVKNVKGNVEFNLQLNFPTVKDLPKDDVKVLLKGWATDLVLPNVVRGLALTGGPYDLAFKDGAITLKGNGQLDGRPIELDWLQYLDSDGREYESKITAKITADKSLRKIFGIGLEDYISGPLPINVTYLDKGVKATVDVKGDLTPTMLHIDPFKYNKSSNVAGTLTLRAILKGEFLEEVDRLQLKTKGFSLTDGRLLFKQLKDGSTDIARGHFPKAIIGKTVSKVDFEITPQNLLKISANASVIDIAPFIDRNEKPEGWGDPNQGKEQPMNISVSANKMLAHEGEALGASKLYIETDDQGEITHIEMDSKVGKGDMYLRFKPEEGTGKRTFRLESSDAGYTLKAFGLYDKVRGGSLIVYGQPQQGDAKGDLYGTAKIENFRVKSAPALAKLLSIMSLTGVQDVLGNEGLSFAKLESDFEWRFRDNANLLVMKDGRTSGSSIGLTFEGILNQGENLIDVSGTIIPVSGINKAIGGIPIIGDILTGGGALIAATYSMKGAANDPKVSVNPLSVLAPGFLRKIFFESDVESKVKKEEKKLGSSK